MRKRSFCLALAVVATLLSGSGRMFAHHAFSAEFDAKKPVTLKGTITKMEWHNPHAWLHIDATEIDGKPVEGGKPVAWALEFGAAAQMYRLGWRKDDLPVGGAVTVVAYRAKNGSNSAAADRVTLASGKQLFATPRE